MNINSRKINDGILLIDLTQNLDLYSVPSLRDFLNNVLDKNEFSKIIISFSKDVYIDSSGFGLLFYYKSILVKKNYPSLRIIADKNKTPLFNLFSIYNHFDIFENLDDAVKSFNIK